MPFAADRAEAASPDDDRGATTPPLVGVGLGVGVGVVTVGGVLVPDPGVVIVGVLVREGTVALVEAW